METKRISPKREVPGSVEQIRREHKKIRERMGASQVQELSGAICRTLLMEEWYGTTEVLFGYYPLGNEVDCRPFLDGAFKAGKRVALPRTGADCRMDFYEVPSLEHLVEGRFHVLEPAADCPLIEPGDGVVLVPGVAFDKKGNRYGYGKGYYDRYFARFPAAKRMALAYGHQMEEALETLATDVKMHRIYTEQGCYRCGED